MGTEFKNVIFTDHVLQRLEQRKITKEMIVTAITDSDKKESEADGDTKFIKTFKDRPVHVVAHYETDEKKWLVKTVWVRGEEDANPFLVQFMRLLPRLLGYAAMAFGWIIGFSRNRNKKK